MISASFMLIFVELFIIIEPEVYSKLLLYRHVKVDFHLGSIIIFCLLKLQICAVHRCDSSPLQCNLIQAGVV